MVCYFGISKLVNILVRNNDSNKGNIAQILLIFIIIYII